MARYGLVEEKPESPLSYGIRTGGRLLARGAETAVGLPVDVAAGISNLLKSGVEKVTGGESKYLPRDESGYFPNNVTGGSQWIRENITQKLTGNALEPETENERKGDEVFQDAVSLFIPLPGDKLQKGAKLSSRFAKKLGISLGGNAAKWTTESLTGSNAAGNAAKLGTFVLTGMLGSRNEVEKFKNAQYEKGLENLSPTAQVNAIPGLNKIKKIAKDVSDRKDRSFFDDRVKGFEDIISKPKPQKTNLSPILNQLGNPIENISKGSKGGVAKIKDIINVKKSWNDYLQDPKLPITTRRDLKRGVGVLNDIIDQYGIKNPSFYEPYRVGEELTGALRSTNRIQDSLSKVPYLRESVDNPIISKLLFGVGAGVGSTVPVPTLVGIGAGVATAREAAKLYQLLSRSSTATKMYKQFLNSALKNDLKGMTRDAIKLNGEANRFFGQIDENKEKGRYSLVD